VALLLAGLVALAAVFALVAALGRTGGGPLTITGATGGLQPAAARMWVVRPGDTLWAIAEAVDPHGDVRPLVDRLSAEVHGAALYPGEPIPIPASIR
jgi:nucleoid-associated protein YgaU